jgi:hypothetical protein
MDSAVVPSEQDALHMYKGNVIEHGENPKRSALSDEHQPTGQRQSPLLTNFNLFRNPEGGQEQNQVSRQQQSFNINGPSTTDTETVNRMQHQQKILRSNCLVGTIVLRMFP